MRWVWVVIKSLASGFVALVVVVVLLTGVLYVYARRAMKGTDGTSVGWDPVSMIMGWGLPLHAAQDVALSFPILIFAIGFAIGFWHFGRPLRQTR